MSHRDHADENAADAAMAHPQEIVEDPDAIEAQPEAAKRGPGAEAADLEEEGAG